MKEETNAFKIAEETYNSIEKVIKETKERAKSEGKRYYTPFAIGQYADAFPAREAQIDIIEQTLLTWLTCPERELAYYQHRVAGDVRMTFGPRCAWLDGTVMAYVERGRYPLKHDELVNSVYTSYNIHDIPWKGYTLVECLQKFAFDNVPSGYGVAPCVLFDLFLRSYPAYSTRGAGFRNLFYGPPALGAFVSTHPAYDKKKQKRSLQCLKKQKG